MQDSECYAAISAHEIVKCSDHPHSEMLPVEKQAIMSTSESLYLIKSETAA
ncbi:hypothetical protein SM0020_30367 [Sinorhizobium meliloti CCNWSX0020]|uniref:Uncharacterized protein n=1 Tax=Sinorhizobium meliloti CCNWSX0020 TaxID=1107881 RepID=H0G966_RHIML|nr:hypothetical protein SM0020_30367 [Sinorhizobium meliloti CCNWSX0020]PII37794.1 hypothetical protein T190_30760 [Sinorhizobium meliloti CCBAU 01290]